LISDFIFDCTWSKEHNLVSLNWRTTDSLSVVKKSPAPDSVLELSEKLRESLKKFFVGEVVDFSFLPLQMKHSPFRTSIYKQLLKTKRGEVLTYQDLAKRCGSPKASRAVGTAMAQNPYPLIVPCHRVVPSQFFKSSHSLNNCGTYTGPGASTTKKLLLKLEGVTR
jgi:methylated-DNA-[protein]-cysteine S-methyltransferase